MIKNLGANPKFGEYRRLIDGKGKYDRAYESRAFHYVLDLSEKLSSPESKNVCPHCLMNGYITHKEAGIVDVFQMYPSDEKNIYVAFDDKTHEHGTEHWARLNAIWDKAEKLFPGKKEEQNEYIEREATEDARIHIAKAREEGLSILDVEI